LGPCLSAGTETVPPFFVEEPPAYERTDGKAFCA
jgi:hypothetical protein